MVDVGPAAYRQTHLLSLKVDGLLVLPYIHQMNRVNSCSDINIVWILLLLLFIPLLLLLLLLLMSKCGV